MHALVGFANTLQVASAAQVLFKMDKAGEGQEIVAADLAQNRDPSFIGFTQQMFLEVHSGQLTGSAPVAMACSCWHC